MVCPLSAQLVYWVATSITSFYIDELIIAMENKVHVWIGSNFSSEEEYMHYFEMDYTTEGDFTDPDYIRCGFCQDLDIDWYDDDFIGIIERKEHEVLLDELLCDAAVEDYEKKRINVKCEQLGIYRANAIVWYQDGSLTVSHDSQKLFNGLHYIGVFDGD